MKKYLLITIGMLLLSPSAFAAGYGEAGCGLGSLLFGTQSGPIQIFAATTNNSSYNQAFGITSGTSNCDAKGMLFAGPDMRKGPDGPLIEGLATRARG